MISEEPLASQPGAPWASFLSGARLAAYAGSREFLHFRMAARALQKVPYVGRPFGWALPPWWVQANDHILVALTAA